MRAGEGEWERSCRLLFFRTPVKILAPGFDFFFEVRMLFDLFC